MNLTTLFHILRARWMIIAGAVLLSVVLVGLVSVFIPRTYTATNELIVDAKAQDPISGQLLSSRMMTGYLATQVDIVRSQKVAEKVIAQESLASEPLLIDRAGGDEPLSFHGSG